MAQHDLGDVQAELPPEQGRGQVPQAIGAPDGDTGLPASPGDRVGIGAGVISLPRPLLWVGLAPVALGRLHRGFPRPLPLGPPFRLSLLGLEQMSRDTKFDSEIRTRGLRVSIRAITFYFDDA